MNITLSKNSWHFKIYSKLISETAPKSLCPYFWVWVLIVLGSPFFLLTGIMRFLSGLFEKKEKPSPKKPILEMTDDEIKEEIKSFEKRLKRSEISAKIMLGVLLAFLLFLLGVSFYFGVKKDGWYVVFRAIFANIGIISTIYWTIRLIDKNWKKIGNSDFVKIPGAMIKAVYTKTCPIINWKN